METISGWQVYVTPAGPQAHLEPGGAGVPVAQVNTLRHELLVWHRGDEGRHAVPLPVLLRVLELAGYIVVHGESAASSVAPLASIAPAEVITVLRGIAGVARLGRDRLRRPDGGAAQTLAGIALALEQTSGDASGVLPMFIDDGTVITCDGIAGGADSTDGEPNRLTLRISRLGQPDRVVQYRRVTPEADDLLTQLRAEHQRFIDPSPGELEAAAAAVAQRLGLQAPGGQPS